MKFLADENIPRNFLRLIQKHGYDIETIHQAKLTGRPDTEIHQYALKHKRTIITFDKDFLVFPQKEINIVFLRFPRTQPKDIIPYLEALLPKLDSFKQPFTLILSREALQLFE